MGLSRRSLQPRLICPFSGANTPRNLLCARALCVPGACLMLSIPSSFARLTGALSLFYHFGPTRRGAQLCNGLPRERTVVNHGLGAGRDFWCKCTAAGAALVLCVFGAGVLFGLWR